jgi:hypothetical protein
VKAYLPRVYNRNVQENQALYKSVNMDANSQPIQSPNITGLRYAIAVIYGFREMLLTMLGASDVGRLRLAFRLNLTDEERLLYLNPIRNLFENCTWIDTQISSGAKLAIVGASRDVDIVMERIRVPIGIAGQEELLNQRVERMNIWLLIMHERAFDFPISSHTSSLDASLRRPWSIRVDQENGVVSETRMVLETPVGVGAAMDVRDLDASWMTNWCIHKSTTVPGLRIWHYTGSAPCRPRVRTELSIRDAEKIEIGDVYAEDPVGRNFIGCNNTIQYADLTSSPIHIERVMADSYKRAYPWPKQKGEVALYIYTYGVADEFVISL